MIENDRNSSLKFENFSTSKIERVEINHSLHNLIENSQISISSDRNSIMSPIEISLSYNHRSKGSKLIEFRSSIWSNSMVERVSKESFQLSIWNQGSKIEKIEIFWFSISIGRKLFVKFENDRTSKHLFIADFQRSKVSHTRIEMIENYYYRWDGNDRISIIEIEISDKFFAKSFELTFFDPSSKIRSKLFGQISHLKSKTCESIKYINRGLSRSRADM